MKRALKHFKAKDLLPVKILYLHSSEFSRQWGRGEGGCYQEVWASLLDPNLLASVQKSVSLREA